MLEHDELETMAGEIAYLRYKMHTEPANFKHLYELIGMECALEICGYDVHTVLFEDELNGVVDVDVHIFDKAPRIYKETFTHIFSLGED